MPWYESALCPTCGVPRLTGLACRCDQLPPSLSAIACAAPYHGPMRAIIQAFKYGGHQTLGMPLAAHLADHPHLRLADVDLVVPVPLHPWRRLMRGFNQAERIARPLGVPVVHALSRRHWTAPQAGLPAEARRGNVRSAFAMASGFPRGLAPLRRRLAGARVLIVDDVVTTGATLTACARVLRGAGVRDVRAATVARTPR